MLISASDASLYKPIEQTVLAKAAATAVSERAVEEVRCDGRARRIPGLGADLAIFARGVWRRLKGEGAIDRVATRIVDLPCGMLADRGEAVSLNDAHKAESVRTPFGFRTTAHTCPPFLNGERSEIVSDSPRIWHLVAIQSARCHLFDEELVAMKLSSTSRKTLT